MQTKSFPPKFAVILFLLSLLAWVSPLFAQPQVNVDSKVQVSFIRPIYNPFNRTYDTIGYIQNVSKETLRAPMSLLVTSTTPSEVKLANADGQTPNGIPFVNVRLPRGELRPHQLTLVYLQFSNPRRLSFTFRQSVLAVLPGAANTPPVANAGPDQTVFVGDTVTLNGGGSSDADGDPLTYNWSFTSRPTGSTATLANGTAVNPTFVVDRAGSYTIRLIVNDGKVDSTADIVIVSTQNSRPVANAGPDQTTLVTHTVTLDGSGSSDFDGNPLTYRWSFNARPTGSTAVLQNSTTVNPRFIADKFGDYTVQLIVNDGLIDSVADTVKISTLNSPPVANAGANQSALVNDVVILDGSGSTDVDGNLLTYSWSIASRPTGSLAVLQNPISVNPSFIVDKFGNYVIQLIVNDGTANSGASTVTISTLNSPPVANAGPDQAVFVGDLVQLNGSGSTDVDGNQLGFAWSIISQPANSQAVLSDPFIVNPTFTVDVAGSYTIQLLVTDGIVPSAADTVTVSTQNRPPVANAGPDQSVALAAVVQLNGNGSSDPDGNVLTYSWSLLSRPSGSSAALANANTVNPTFTADKAGNYVAQLIVNDGTTDSAPDTVAISTQNSIPIANAGPDQSVFTGATVQLDGSGSYDPDGQPLFYAWSLTTLPSGSNATLSDPAIANPTFTADRSGIYIGQLMVGDGALVSAPDTVQIQTVNRSPIAQNDSANTNVDTPVIANVLSNDSDPDNDPLAISAVTQGTNGAVTNTATTVTYTPASNFNGSDSFTYTVIDGRGGSAVGTVTVIVNRAPLVNAGLDQTITLPAVASLNGTVTDDGLPTPINLTQSWSTLSGPGTVSFGNANAAATTASFSQAGTYVLRLTASDSSLTAFDDVQIVVNPAPPLNRNPIAIDDSALTALNTQIQISVLTNDSDPDKDAIAITSVTQGTNGATSHNGTITTYTPNNNFSGIDTFTYTIGDGKGGTATATVTVTVDRAPLVDAGPDQTTTLPATASLNGSVTDDGLPTPVSLTQLWTVVSGPGTVTFGSPTAATSSATFSQAGVYVLRLSANDGFLTAFDDVQITVNAAGGGLPVIVAPPIDPSVATTVFESTKFLYTGANPVQTGVAPGTIEAQRAAVLRGKVMDRAGNVLPGATVTILNHPQFGQTLSRSDGEFDMAVNGGGLMTIDYQLTGYLPAQRQVNVPWQDFIVAPDVALIPLDTNVTTITANAAVMQVHQSTVSTDADGSRKATLLFPAGTTAQMVMADGSTQPLTNLNVRASEYTVGNSGPMAMPGLLPPSSGYTYAVELSVDEAITANATMVTFNQPIPTYVENFLGFPVGGAVPTGYYDKLKGQWIASANGRVIKILGVTNNLADLDVTGDNVADSGAALSNLGITDAERQNLATLYVVNTSLWRVPVTHFTPWDHNWPYGPPTNAIPPPGQPLNNPPVDAPNQECGSVIGCENQTLGQALPVTGTPFTLHYQSERTPGRKDAYTLNIPVSGPSIPPSLRAMRVEVIIAGRIYKQAFAPGANVNTTVAWDGLDTYGRPLQGEQIATINVHYDYAPQYFAVSSAFENSFARAEASGATITVSRSASTFAFSKTWTEIVGAWDARAQGLGGWSLSIHHAYDPISRTLLLGNGGRRSADTLSLNSTITTVAGDGTMGFGGDGGPALAASLSNPNNIIEAPDGSILFVDSANARVRRIAANGIITTVAGNGTSGVFSGDGIPATASALNPSAIALGPDGSIFITDGSQNRVRRVAPNGIITTVAGNGVFGFSGDGGPATAASLNVPSGIAVGADGSLFIGDVVNRRIRRVAPDGIITTVAGTGVQGFSGDGGPATAARIAIANDLAVGPDGSLFFVDAGNNRRIRRVATNGIITTVAGNGGFGLSGDGGPATAAGLNNPFGIAVGPDGSIYIADSGNHRVRRVGPDGIINTVAGSGVVGNTADGFSGDGGPATAAKLQNPLDVMVGAGGSIFIADAGNVRIRRIGPALAGFSVTDIVLPSEDGREAYSFNSSGRHLSTLDALTGAPLYQFAYNAAGHLISITDRSGNVTTIQRSGATPIAIVAPGGQNTTLTVNSNGYLATVANPAGNTHAMSYSTDGLMQSFSDPLSHLHSFTYDALGRLTKDQDPAGGSTTLSRTQQSNGYTVTSTTSLGRVRSYQIERLSTGALRRTVTQPSGAQTVTTIGTDGGEQTTYPDGSSSSVQYGPDPRWGMLAPVPTSRTFTNPGGLTRTVTTSRTATLSNVNNVFSLTNLTETVTDNGAVSTNVYDGTTRRFTSTTPAGRSGALSLDAQGRIVQSQLAGLAPVGFVYDNTGLLTAVTEGSGATSRSTTLAYNPARYLSGMSDALGRSVSFTYDLAGRVVSRTLADGGVIHSSYNAAGKATAVTPPGRPAHGFAYSLIDRMSSYTAPDVGIGNTATQYSYNTDRALTSVTRPDGQLLDLTYDAAGRMSTLDFAGGQLSFTYSPTTGQLANINAPGGIGQSYSYSGALLTGMSWSGPVAGAIAYTYDNNFRVTTESVNGANSVSFAFDADGLATSAGALSLTRNPQNGQLTGTALGGVTDSMSYNNLGNLTNYSAAYSGSGIYSASYVRDALSRITQKSETVNGVTTVFNYSYDLASRLVEVKANGSITAAYSYDGNGNRLTGPGGVNGTYDNQDRLVSYGSATYTYRANGELQSKTASGQNTAYQYDTLGNLRNVTLPGGMVIDYLIDGRNRRIGKKVNGVLVQAFLYQGALRPAAELGGAGNVVSRFVYATRRNVPEYMIKGGVTYRIVTDYLGSPRLVIDVATGTVAQRLDYDEFGNVTNDTNPGFQPFGFAGGLYDTHTKLVRFGARDYDAVTGRWTAKDPIGFRGGDTNLYGYVRSNPVNAIDPSGLADEQTWGEWFWEIFGIGAGGFVDPSPLEGAVPFTEEDAKFHVNFVGGLEQVCLASHAQGAPGYVNPDRGRILGLTPAEHIRQYHPEAAATPAPAPSPSPSPSPTPAVSDTPWMGVPRDQVDRALRNSGGIGR